MAIFSPGPHWAEGISKLQGSLLRALMPFMRIPPSWPKAPPLHTITSGLRPTCGFGGGGNGHSVDRTNSVTLLYKVTETLSVLPCKMKSPYLMGLWEGWPEWIYRKQEQHLAQRLQTCVANLSRCWKAGRRGPLLWSIHAVCHRLFPQVWRKWVGPGWVCSLWSLKDLGLNPTLPWPGALEQVPWEN